jgi:S-adenosylmethionine decarboxylase
MHLVIDGYGGDTGKMWDLELVRDFLTTYPDNLGMTRITEPKVLEYNGPNVEDAGVSGFVIIAESHISIHTFPYRNYVNIDIFSCKSFDHEQAAKDAKNLFGLQEMKTWLLDRGLEWLDSEQGMTQTREQRSVLRSDVGVDVGVDAQAEGASMPRG